MQATSRAPAPVPPITELAELRALYTRVHWLNIADIDRTIAQNEEALAQASAGTSAWAVTTIQNCLPLLRQRKEEYLLDYEHYVGRSDNLSLETMRLFVVRARELHGRKPEFSFLFVPSAGAGV